ncbi:ectopic P granules protein 5 homolog isoform X1 [Glossina fuscipes]|uniref:Ectopic P granules protein 5 homolog isoform X1 n=1 Tax=Glossina fuscipes TaxID=7396 RepID=A0A8U0WIM4_9MUSC|nr:ectopic P granules protein 5 homolog isoform X1 [Glossina fuscipes]
MATIEKSKTKKTKKTKIVGYHDAKGNFRDVNETTENCVAQQMQTNETLAEELDDFVELNGAAKSSTEIQECFTITACKNQDQRQDEYENKEDSVQVSLETISSKKGHDNAQLKSGQGSIENPLPSAPLPVESYEPIPAVTVTQYPNLLPLQQHEETPVSEVVYKQPKVRSPGFRLALSELQPFNCEQLRELYYCAELQQVQQFEIEFLNNSLRETYESDPLHVALKTYYQLQSKLTMNIHDVNKFREEATEAQNHIWLKESVTETFSAKCDDNIELKESVTYEIIKVNDKNLKAATAALTVLFDIISDTYTTNLITAKITKLKIDQMIDEIISFPLDTNDNLMGPLKLQPLLDNDSLQCLAKVRRALSILFHFARKLSPNKNFSDNLILWIRKLVSIHLHLATKEDYWFLIFNILRCPSGVGAWACEFLQVPCLFENSKKPFDSAYELPLSIDSAEISLCLSILKILLTPVKRRNDYLKQFTQSQKEVTDPIQEERWILIDSDGEDEHTSAGECVGLRENDLIALLNQIPFEELFRSVLMIQKFLNDYIIQIDLISSHHLLRIFAFFNQLVDLFGEGMLTYNTERYKQLAKRLGRLMRHSLQYISDYHELFRNNNLWKDAKLLERLALEYNVLLLKACSYIYRTRNLSTWQYFSSLPFTNMDSDTIWQIFYYLNVGFPDDFTKPEDDYMALVTSSDIWSKFNVANADSSDEDLYYLLQAFFEMANDRDRVKDWDLIKIIFFHIFRIGFINRETRDGCYKSARDMLVNLCLCYEDLMSYLLTQLKVYYQDTENVIYLYKSLPLETWKPSLDCFEILSNWLLHFDHKSSENLLARIIISHLNWGFDSDDQLFLPHNIHVRMACLISEALTEHAPEVVGISGISESVRQMSSIIDFSKPTKEQFSTWCWSIASMLRLHIMDQNYETIKKVLQDPNEYLTFILDLERIDLICQGVNENRPLAIYVAILVSLHGHFVPLICQKGFDLMQRLLSDQRYTAVIRCLELITPLFLEVPDILANAESFQKILNTLLNADRTYIKMTKDVIYPNSVGPVLELLDNMIHHQITSYMNYGLSTPLNLINLWLHCLTSLPNWQNTYVVYLLDKILRIAYQFPDAYNQTIEYFSNYYKDWTDWKGANRGLKGFFSSNNSKLPLLSPDLPWLALVLLEIEFRTHDSHIWDEFLRQIFAAGTKPNLDAVLKKTLNIAKRPTYSAQTLCLYKYANLLAGMDVKHALYPIINQKFFELYLSRVPTHYDEHSFQQTHGIADKFYDFNVSLMKKLKNNLEAAEKFYETEATKHRDDGFVFYCTSCAKIMHTYCLWLVDSTKTVNKMSKDQDPSIRIPTPLNKEKLREIFNGNKSHWTEFLYLPAIRKEQRQQADQWAHRCFRSKLIRSTRTPIVSKIKPTPMERIKTHLCSYDRYLPPPIYVKPQLNLPNELTKSTLNELKDKLKILTATARKFYIKTSELSAISRSYMEEIIRLYKMITYEEMKVKNCNYWVYNHKCRKPARIITQLQRIHKDERVQQNVDNCRRRHETIINEMLNENVDKFAQHVVQIGQTIRLLLMRQECEETKSDSALAELKNETGIKFYYYIVDNMNEMTINFNATNKFYSELLTDLAILIQENQEKQGLTILELSIKRTDLLKQLSVALVPCRTRPTFFINMYKYLIDSHLRQCDPNTLFVLFSKFDLISWFEDYRPKLHDISQLLQLILQGLESWSQPGSNILQDQFRRHLVHIFNYDFPEHYGEVMQLVLDHISEQRLLPDVFLDLLNSLLLNCNCEQLQLTCSSHKVQGVSAQFARQQNLFNLKAITDTILLFARHFEKERLHHGLHGLYPKHQNYCTVIAMWFSCFGHSVVIKAICTYQELLADQICDIVFGSIIEMYAPWLITYTEQTMPYQTSNWIRQLADTGHGKILFPWSKQHAKTSKIIVTPFINTLIFILENLPISNQILSHTFGWYIHHFAVTRIENYIYEPIHEGIAQLSWEHFTPHVDNIEMFYNCVQKFIPDCHAMLGHIFIRINWVNWFADTFPTIPATLKISTISRLLTIFVKIAFEPNIHMHVNTSKILEDAVNYPWHMVDFAEFENLLKWCVQTVEPTIILKIPEESNYVDRAVLELLRESCIMKSQDNQTEQLTHAMAKRILYTRSMICLQRACVAKNPKLLTSKNGRKIFIAAFDDLLRTLEEMAIVHAAGKSPEEIKRHAGNLMLEIVLPMQTQSEETSNLHIECMRMWMESSTSPGNVLMLSILNAVGHMKAFISGIYSLLECSIGYYFRSSEESLEWHIPTWLNLLKILSMTLDKLELMPIMHNSCFFVLHIFILHKMEKLPNVGAQITFLQDLSQLIENLKTEPDSEPARAIVWGAMISWGCKIILKEPQNVKKSLYMLAKHLQIISTQAESWGDSLLGAVGLKKEVITTKRKVLTRCLAIVIFALFPLQSGSSKSLLRKANDEYHSSLRELSMLLANKKFIEVKPLIVQSIGILKENPVPNLEDIPHLVCRLIGLFYKCNFLTTLPEVWLLDFQFNT